MTSEGGRHEYNASMKQMCALVAVLVGAFCGVAHAQIPSRQPAADKRPPVVMRKHRPMVIEALIQRDQRLQAALKKLLITRQSK